MAIKDGYPKLAIYNRPPKDFLFPYFRDSYNILRIPRDHRSNFYNSRKYTLTPNELIILVHDKNGSIYDYFTHIRKVYNSYYVVPLNAIEQGLIPKTSIYSWKQSYSILPIMGAEELTIVDKDELERQMKRENKYRTK